MKTKYFNKKIAYSQGFTLVEMAIVLVIFGLLLTMLLSPLTTQRDAQNRAKTQVLLNEAKEALMGYAVTNGYLPCPDTDLVPDGVENRNATGTFDCTEDEGVLPWNDLGIDRTDAWSRYFRYRVDSTFSSKNKPFTIANSEGNSDININRENDSPLVSTLSQPAAVILSHGTNGFGAKNLNTTSPANQEPEPTGADEIINANDDDSVFVSHPPTPQGTANEFDDMLVWISPKVLINRMIVAERLP
jgi:prepilin-type N-terminal cleavage/methylation domain-containing protein